MAIPAAVLLTYIWETSRQRRTGRSRARAFGRALGLETLGVVVAFAIVPLVVYVVAWTPWFVHFDPDPVEFLRQHRDMWNYHRDLRATALDSATDTFTPTHGYYSKAWTWIPMLRPVNYFLEDLGPDIRQILAIGNPVLFWGTMWTIPYCAWAWWRKRTERDWKPGFIVVAFAGLYVPWLFVARPQFFFYALPLTPFMALAAVYTLRDLAAAHLVVRDHETGEVATDPQTGEPAVSRRRPYLPFVWGYVDRRGRVVPVDVAGAHGEPHHRRDVEGAGVVQRVGVAGPAGGVSRSPDAPGRSARPTGCRGATRPAPASSCRS